MPDQEKGCGARIAFRFDDPSVTSDQCIEQGVLEALQEYGACATFACIPFRVVGGMRKAFSPSRAEPLIDAFRAGIIELAQHGHSHQNMCSRPPFSEFVGRGATDQYSLLYEGLQELTTVFGERPRGFVPPWNTFDAVTLDSLNTLGFEWISSGWGGHKCKYRNSVSLMHGTAQLRSIETVLDECVRFEAARYVAVVVMHHFDFAESGSERAVIDMTGFRNILARIKEERSARVCTIGEIAESLAISNQQRSLQYHLSKTRFMRRLLPSHGFLDVSILRGLAFSAKENFHHA